MPTTAGDIAVNNTDGNPTFEYLPGPCLVLKETFTEWQIDGRSRQSGGKGCGSQRKQGTRDGAGPSIPRTRWQAPCTLSATICHPPFMHPLLFPTLEASPSWPRTPVPGGSLKPHTWAPDSLVAGPCPHWPCWHSVACSHSVAGEEKGQGWESRPPSPFPWTEAPGDGGNFEYNPAAPRCLSLTHPTMQKRVAKKEQRGRPTLCSASLQSLLESCLQRPRPSDFWKCFQTHSFMALWGWSSDSPLHSSLER